MGGRRIGVLALQGAFIEHIKILEYLGVTALPVGKAETLKQLDGLIIPGGESTTVGKLMQRYELAQPIQELARQGMPIFGTCAGMILLAQRVVNDEVPTLGLLDMTVQRNGFGRQRESCVTDLQIAGFHEPVEAVFIRAPFARETASEVRILANYEARAVMVQQDHLLACAFHPELTEDTRVHELFLQLC